MIGTCSGDSGGPLVVFSSSNSFQRVQIGIVSAGPQCALFELPGIYVKVERHIKWILENVDGWLAVFCMHMIKLIKITVLLKFIWLYTM